MGSFSSSIKHEIIKSIESEACCERSLLSVLLKMNGNMVLAPEAPQGFVLQMNTENAALARCVFQLSKKRYSVSPEIIVHRRVQLRKNRVYQLHWKQDVQTILDDLGFSYCVPSLQMNSEDSKIAAWLQKDCCCRAYIRGAFLAGGSVSDPEKSSYHLEILVADAEHGQFLCQLMKKIELHPRKIQRKSGWMVYVKEGEQIGDFLRWIGAHPSLLAFENVRILKGMRNSVNRAVNCETANLNKTVQAAMRQIDYIQQLDRTIGLQQLPVHLREIAELRRDHPELSLEELGRLLPSGVASKSAVNHRLRKLEDMARRLAADVKDDRG